MIEFSVYFTFLKLKRKRIERKIFFNKVSHNNQNYLGKIRLVFFDAHRLLWMKDQLHMALSLTEFQVCCDFISFLIFKIVIECPEEIFKKLWSVTIYLYDKSWKYSS